jgi:hypothetical protein
VLYKEFKKGYEEVTLKEVTVEEVTLKEVTVEEVTLNEYNIPLACGRG